jgi:hypothetical protein
MLTRPCFWGAGILCCVAEVSEEYSVSICSFQINYMIKIGTHVDSEDSDTILLWQIGRTVGFHTVSTFQSRNNIEYEHVHKIDKSWSNFHIFQVHLLDSWAPYEINYNGNVYRRFQIPVLLRARFSAIRYNVRIKRPPVSLHSLYFVRSTNWYVQ